MLDLSQNLNPFAPDVATLAARHACALRRYPDPAAATRLLADAMGVDPDRVALTNGAAEAIDLVAREIGGRVLSEPEFGLHPRGDSGPVWRSDPHSPSGRLAGAGEVADVWDEAFYPLATGRWTAGRSGAVVGSLTKTFACPGLRLGYLIADDVERFVRRQPQWSVGSLAVAFVLVRDCASFGLDGMARIAVPDAAGLQRLAAALEAAGDADRTANARGEIDLARSRRAATVREAAGQAASAPRPESNGATPERLPDVAAIIFDVGDTLVHAAAPGTPVAALRAEPIGEAVSELRRLGERYRLGALTDTSVMTGEQVREALGTCGLADLLEVIVTSVDVGAEKPDPRGLRAAMRRLGVTPERTLFVGDADVDEGAAVAAGTHFVRAGGGRSPGEPVDRFLR